MVKHAERKRKRNPLLPVFGIGLAVVFALFAFLLLDPARTFLLSNGVTFGTLQPSVRDLLIGGMIWFVLFGTSMFLVAIMVGRNFDEKENIDFLKQSAKMRKQRERERKRRR